MDRDRRAVRGRLFHGLPIELVIEDGADGSIGESIDVDSACGSGFEPITAERALEAQDAEAGPEALFGMRSAFQNEFTQRSRRRSDSARIAADTLDRPIGVALMTGRHVVADGCVGVVTACTHMGGDPLAPGEDLHGACGEPHLDFAAGEAVGNAVEVILDLDVKVDADAAYAPFGKHVGLYRQGLERWPVQFLKELTAGFSQAAHGPVFVEASKHLADRPVQLRETMEDTVAQTTEEPPLYNKHAALDLGLVAGAPWPCRQDCRAVMGRHVGISSIDLRLVETGLDDGDLGVIRNDEVRDTADRLEGTRVRTDPVAEPLAPCRLR